MDTSIMAKYYVRNNSGEWVDCCTTPVHIRDASGNWRRLGHGNKVYANGVWHDIICTIPKYTITASLGFINANSTITYSIRGNVDGTEVTHTLRWNDSDKSLQYDTNSQIVIAWNTATTSMKVNGAFVEGGVYMFNLSSNTSIQGYEIATGGPGGGEEET